jgi:hypothetical protein
MERNTKARRVEVLESAIKNICSHFEIITVIPN